MQKAFKAIDDWGYGWIDKNNLKRFLRNNGVVM
jgi:Ca2+-binding EF-hand superfamily protein